MHDAYAKILGSFQIPEEYIPIFTALLKKAFNNANQNKQSIQKDLTKRHTECKKQIDDVNIKFGLGKIGEEVYSATINALKDQLAGIERGLEENGENLSSLTKFVGDAFAYVC